MSGNISCSNCGNQLSEQDMFCGQCGMPRSRTTEHSTTICARCGYPGDPSQPFCTHCNSQALTEPGTPPYQQSQSLDLDALYREGVIARSKGGLSNLERAASLWQQILDRDPDYKEGTLAPQMQRLLQELHPLRVQHLRQQAVQASQTGAWDKEIASWEALLGLKPQDAQAMKRIPIAERNHKYAWRYENAQQFVRDGNREAARTTLQELWHDAPSYGDPAGLAKKVKLPVPPDYEKVKVAKARKDKRLQFITGSPPIGLGTSPQAVWFCAFCLISGLSSIIGILTHFWFWAVVTVIVATSSSYILYRKTMSLFTIVNIAVISGILACSLAWYTSTLHYNQAKSDTWLYGSLPFITGETISGLCISFLLCGIFPLLLYLSFRDNEDISKINTFLFISLFISLFIILGSILDLGIRQLDGLPVSLGMIFGDIFSVGLICSLFGLRGSGQSEEEEAVREDGT